MASLTAAGVSGDGATFRVIGRDATVVEGRLMGVNPYGQPGVETYKRNMKSLLKASS